uniref:Uncharacterized LOC100178159 n=1 Tax=Ciona intestinalis TaxID=7719 RepID=F6ZS58_CIOIN|nr:uncharacterized protein LOC100178159 [Ciona intestinalis]|eukprot:XP_002128665.1 uncharacterized protein LOC100178159 [Ciona intestinalis]
MIFKVVAVLLVCTVVSTSASDHLFKVRQCVRRGKNNPACLSLCPEECSAFQQFSDCLVDCTRSGQQHKTCFRTCSAASCPAGSGQLSCDHARVCHCAKCMRAQCVPAHFGDGYQTKCPKAFENLHC